jgi:hypothetical protein
MRIQCFLSFHLRFGGLGGKSALLIKPTKPTEHKQHKHRTQRTSKNVCFVCPVLVRGPVLKNVREKIKKKVQQATKFTYKKYNSQSWHPKKGRFRLISERIKDLGADQKQRGSFFYNICFSHQKKIALDVIQKCICLNRTFFKFQLLLTFFSS